MKSDCPIYKVMKYMGKKWTVIIIAEIYKGKSKWKRYSELKKKIPKITPKMLSDRLKSLEKEGIVKNKIDAEKFPVKSKYTLTKKGEDFFRVIEEVKEWGLKWKVGHSDCPDLDCKECEF